MNDKKIKILYDISMLGNSYKTKIAKAGLYQVIQNILKKLLLNKKFEIFYLTSIDNYYECYKYLKDNKLSSVNFLYPNNLLFFQSYIKYFIFYFKLKIKQSENIFKKIFYFLICRNIKNLYFIYSIITKIFVKQSYNLEKFKVFDIYQTGYHPITSFNNNVKEFQIVHDLIPIIFPEYCGLKGYERNTIIHKVLETINNQTYIFCVSENTKKDLLAYKKNLDPGKVFTINLGVGENFYPCKDLELITNIRVKYGIPKNARYILSLCTLEPRKNLNFVIKNFYDILIENKEINDLYLVIVGTKGWDYDSIFKEIDSKKNLQNKIILTGFIPDEDLSPIYSSSLVFVYPSFYEGFGLPPLEAMKCGVPVITSNTSSLPEVVGDAGIMIDPRDNNAFKRNVLRFYYDEEYCKIYSRKGIRRALNYNWDKTAEKIVEIYKRVMNEN